MLTFLETDAATPRGYCDAARGMGTHFAVVGDAPFADAFARSTSVEQPQSRVVRAAHVRDVDAAVDVLLLAPGVAPAEAFAYLAGHPGTHLVAEGRKASYVAVVALHKSGTNLVTSLLRKLGYTTVGEGTGPSPYRDGLWEAHEAETLDDLQPGSAYFAHSLPLPDIGGPHQVPRPLFSRLCDQSWPLLFHHRDPRAVLSSLVRYLTRRTGGVTAAPFHQMVGKVLRQLDETDRLTFAIRELGDYLRWSFCNNGWLLTAPFAVRSSYESLVGERGGGDAAAAADTVLKLLLELRVPGDPHQLVVDAYDETSRTFSRGSAVAWRADYSDAQLREFDVRYGDVLERYGYPAWGV